MEDPKTDNPYHKEKVTILTTKIDMTEIHMAVTNLMDIRGAGRDMMEAKMSCRINY